MSTPTLPAVRQTPDGTVKGRVITPAAVAGPVHAAAFKLGNVLKEIIHAVPAAFSSENDILAAVTAIEDFVKAFVPDSALPALADGTQRAPVEDVTKRPAPAGVSYSVPNPVPVIDYDRLAAAIVRAQYAEHRPVPAPAPENPVTQETEFDAQ